VVIPYLLSPILLTSRTGHSGYPLPAYSCPYDSLLLDNASPLPALPVLLTAMYWVVLIIPYLLSPVLLTAFVLGSAYHTLPA
jgi:hypothetical protein